MNEYDDILNRIVEEFYDTGKVVLSELDLPDELQLHSSEEQKKLNKELVQNLIKCKTKPIDWVVGKVLKENMKIF